MARIESEEFQLKNGRRFVLRGIEPDDAEKFLEFRRQVAQESTHTMQYVGMPLPTADEARRRLESQQNDPTTLNIGVFDEEREIVGYLNFRVPFAEHPWARHIGQFGMMVLRAYWGNGIGTRLLALQDAHAKKLGVLRIEAMVRVHNERGVRLYERAGYRIEGTRKKAARIDDDFHDEFFIAKMLDDEMLSWRPPMLETSRLLLRPIEVSDAESIFAYAKNPAVSRHTLWEAHESVQNSLDYIKDYVHHYYREGVPEPWGITFKSDPRKVIGTVGCFWVSRGARSMELAYALAEEHWGRGLVAEAAEAVMADCFARFGLKRIQARCKVDNAASARVMEKLGMQHEGTTRAAVFHRGRFWDLHTYAKVLDEGERP